ncbi:MAG TPA: hypothetical protein VIL07_03290 [Symbiobacteriaceae bacterium]
MAHETVLILPDGAAEPTGSRETPFGPAPVFDQQQGPLILIRAEGTDPRALIYAAKEAGARRVLAAETAAPVSHLLEPGDLVVPEDVIDLTRLRPFTFFVGKGYGFIKLNPPFCPDLMAWCLEVARRQNPRSFARAVYVGVEGPRDPTPAELRMYRQWGGDLAGTGLLPEVYLARELELCYAAVVAVGNDPNSAAMVLQEVAAVYRPGRTPCRCGETMRDLRKQGVVGEDWREWIAYP